MVLLRFEWHNPVSWKFKLCKGSSVGLYPSQVLGSGKLFSAPKEINNTKINTNYSS